MMRTKKGFVIIVVVSLLSVLLIVSVVIVNIGCSEIIQTKAKNDALTAYYTATTGAELLYARLKNKSDLNYTVTWPQSTSGTFSVGSNTFGTYSASATVTASQEFAIVSRGVHNGKTSIVNVKYGYQPNPTLGVPVGSIGPILLQGKVPVTWLERLIGKTSTLTAAGPVMSNSTVTPNPAASPVFVNGEILANQTTPAISFWVDADGNSKLQFDTCGDGARITSLTGQSYVSRADDLPPVGDPARAAAEAIFDNDDVYPPARGSTPKGDGIINDKDAYFRYYTHDLNEKYSLGIAPEESNYYYPTPSEGETYGTEWFGPFAVPEGTQVVFVDGDAGILFNATEWWGNEADFAVVSMNDIVIVEPVTGSDDRLTLVAYEDIATGGLNFTGVGNGNFTAYSNDDFYAVFGGRTTGSVFAGGDLTAQTLLCNAKLSGWPGELLNRQFDRGGSDWADAENRPIALPPGYPMMTIPFNIKSEDYGGYKPRWQRS